MLYRSVAHAGDVIRGNKLITPPFEKKNPVYAALSYTNIVY